MCIHISELYINFWDAAAPQLLSVIELAQEGVLVKGKGVSKVPPAKYARTCVAHVYLHMGRLMQHLQTASVSDLSTYETPI